MEICTYSRIQLDTTRHYILATTHYSGIMPVYKKHIVPRGKGAVGVKVACSNRYNRDNDAKPGFCRF